MADQIFSLHHDYSACTEAAEVCQLLKYRVNTVCLLYCLYFPARYQNLEKRNIKNGFAYQCVKFNQSASLQSAHPTLSCLLNQMHWINKETSSQKLHLLQCKKLNTCGPMLKRNFSHFLPSTVFLFFSIIPINFD